MLRRECDGEKFPEKRDGIPPVSMCVQGPEGRSLQDEERPLDPFKVPVGKSPGTLRDRIASWQGGAGPFFQEVILGGGIDPGLRTGSLLLPGPSRDIFHSLRT